VVETSLNSYLQNPKAYKGKKVIIVASIKDVLKNPSPLIGKKIKVKGFVKYIGFRGYPYWNFILMDKEGNSIRCYEKEYRVQAWIVPIMAVKEAEKKNEIIIAVGKLKKKGLLELDWIEYRGEVIDTDYKPPSVSLFF